MLTWSSLFVFVLMLVVVWIIGVSFIPSVVAYFAFLIFGGSAVLAIVLSLFVRCAHCRHALFPLISPRPATDKNWWALVRRAAAGPSVGRSIVLTADQSIELWRRLEARSLG
jgi:hypothetical protein